MVWATNVPEWIVLQFALAKAGAILVTANTSLRAKEIDYLLRQSEAATIVTISGFRGVDYIAALEEIGATRGRIPGLERLVFVSRGDETAPSGFIDYRALRTAGTGVDDATLDARTADVAIDDVINMQYTSGTTGFPKGVMLSSRNIVNNGEVLGRMMGYTPDDRLCLCVPLFHCFGCVIGVLGAFTHGAALCPDRMVRSSSRAGDGPARTLHGAVRRAHDVPGGTGASGLSGVRPDVAADRHHGRRAVPGTGDAPRDGRHASA